MSNDSIISLNFDCVENLTRMDSNINDEQCKKTYAPSTTVEGRPTKELQGVLERRGLMAGRGDITDIGNQQRAHNSGRRFLLEDLVRLEMGHTWCEKISIEEI